MFDVEKIRAQFPILGTRINGKSLIYFDNAATSQKPQCVIDSQTNFYTTSNANVHRGLYELSGRADEMWQQAHVEVAKYLNADKTEVFFTSGATSGLNWLAQTANDQLLKPGDVIVISQEEHHSNILPWEYITQGKQIIIEEIPIKPDLSLDLEYLKFVFRKYGKRVKIVSVAHMSNVLGIVNDIKKIAEIVHENGSLLVVDGAQGIVHNKVDVKALDCDFYIFSGHKIFGPTGTGVVYGKKEVLNALYPVWQGGEMIDSYSNGKLILKPIPTRFEAGTPNIAGGIGLATAINWYGKIEGKEDYEKDLSSYCYNLLNQMPEVKVISSPQSVGIFTFTVKNVHPHDIASDLNEYGIAIRGGFHCAQPLHEKLGITGSCRVSLSIINTKSEVEYFINSLKEIIKKY
ncbi:aminotransferase class V-fold PLP-dependent enzyme [Candidatus Dojkabacteria bacterium]|jgi:cysteine desulfurase/selenocysteine lyase|nr:aminotransferase class V-fold PLP-dependent enzyme [Candidatus Dojkabacteria bacterium]